MPRACRHRYSRQRDRWSGSAERHAFGLPAKRSAHAYAITANGTTTIAIVDAYGYSRAETDLAKYRSQYGLPPCTTADGCFKRSIRTAGRISRDDTGWAQSPRLTSAWPAPCALVASSFSEAATPSFSNLATAVNTASAAWRDGDLEQLWWDRDRLDSVESAYNHPGKAITVSTGDSGYGSPGHVAARDRSWRDTLFAPATLVAGPRLHGAAAEAAAAPSMPSRASRRMDCAPSGWKPTFGDRRSQGGVAVYGPTSGTAPAG